MVIEEMMDQTASSSFRRKPESSMFLDPGFRRDDPSINIGVTDY